jgi:hypothetical protein
MRPQADIVRARYGDAGYRAILATMQGSQRFLSGSPVPQIYCPAEVLTNIARTREQAVRAAERTFFVHARSIYRLFFMESDPVRALHLAAYVYTRYFAGTGRTTVEAGGTMARIRILGVEVGSHANCLAALAYFRAAAHLSVGGRVEARELGCVTRGDSCCEFELRWTEEDS